MAHSSGVTPSGSGRLIAAPFSIIAATQSRQPSRDANISAVMPPGERGCARGSPLTSGVIRSVAVFASRSAPTSTSSRVIGPWLFAAAHINAVCWRCDSLALGFAPLSSSIFAAATLVPRATSISGVCPSAPGAFGSAPASSSALMISEFEWNAASRRGVVSSLFLTFGFAPAFSSCLTCATSSLLAATSKGVDPLRVDDVRRE